MHEMCSFNQDPPSVYLGRHVIHVIKWTRHKLRLLVYTDNKV